jgi:hypothetical protein
VELSVPLSPVDVNQRLAPGVFGTLTSVRVPVF